MEIALKFCRFHFVHACFELILIQHMFHKDSAFRFELNCSRKISFTDIMLYEDIKKSGASFIFYYLGQDGIEQVVIRGKLESDKLGWDKLT